jgi:multidrug resistance efflux pump
MTRRRQRRIAAAVAILLIALAAAFSCAGAQEPDASRRNQATARGTLDVEGGIVQLAAPRDGVIREVFVREGQTVTRDEPLAVIDDRASAIQAAIAAAQLAEQKASLAAQSARAASARRERDRLAPLSRAGAVSQKLLSDAQTDLATQEAELSQREAAVATAEGQLQLAEFERNVRTIRAPSDGAIVRRLVQAGDGVSAQNVSPLFWFAPALERIVRVEIEDYFVKQLKVGQKAEIALDSDPATIVARGELVRLGRAFGPRRVTAYDPRERVDVRVLEGIVATSGSAIDAPLGQRVIVTFLKGER